jgi:hypothetical protein
MVRKEKVEIVLITQRKCSILLALEEHRRLFHLVVSAAKCYDPDFYLKLAETLVEGCTNYFTQHQ